MWDVWAVLESINVADVQQDVTPCSKPRGTASGLCISPGAGGSLFEKCHSAMSRAGRGHSHIPLPCGLALLCQVLVFLHVFFVCLGLSVPGGELTSVQCKAPQRPGCTWLSRREIEQLQIVALIFWQF